MCDMHPHFLEHATHSATHCIRRGATHSDLMLRQLPHMLCRLFVVQLPIQYSLIHTGVENWLHRQKTNKTEIT